MSSTNDSIFLTRKLQEQLLAPYRKMRGFSQFTIGGATATDLSLAAASEISKSWMRTDPELVFEEVEELISRGKSYHRVGLPYSALCAYRQGAFKCWSIKETTEGKQLREVGGPNFLNRVAALYFNFYYNSAHVVVKNLRTLPPYDLPRMFGREEPQFYEHIDFCHDAPYTGTDWTPSPQQMRKVFYGKRKEAGYLAISSGH
jgi:hypothetical protein